MRCAMLYCVVRLQSVCEHHSPESINRFQKIDRRGVQNARLFHRFFEISRRGKVLSPLRILSVEDDNNLALLAIGGMIDHL